MKIDELLPQIEITNSTRIWLDELYDLHLKRLPAEIPRLRRKLHAKLDKDFNPLKLDERIVKNGNRITPLGIHILDPNYGIFNKIDMILKLINRIIQEEHDIDEIDIEQLKSRLRLGDDKLTQILNSLENLNCRYLSGYTKNADGYYTKISVGNDSSINRLLAYNSIEEFTKEHFYEKSKKLENKETFVKSKELNGLEMKILEIAPPHYIHLDRIEELKAIKSKQFDLTKLIFLCYELNIAVSEKLYHSVGILLRTILDHCPPIFGKSSFIEVANNYGTKSFGELMKRLENSSRKIADMFLHTPIRKRETLPTFNQINFSHELDVLLGEICRILKE